MLIWLVKTGEPLPTDGSGVRLMRTGQLARALIERGNRVVWWSTDFDHARKVIRGPVPDGLELGIHLLHGTPYQRNVSLARIVNHLQTAEDFRRRAPAEPTPDLIVCSVPTVDLAVAVTAYATERGVPIVLDMRDKWPEALVELFPPALRFFAKAALQPMQRGVEWAAARATGITGITPEFVDWGVACAGRARGPLDRHFPQAYTSGTPPPADLQAAEAFWDRLGVTLDDTTFRVAYVGSAGHQSASQMRKAIEAARILHNDGTSIQFVLCGDGEQLEAQKAAARGLTNVVMPGWVDRAQIWSLMARSQVGLVIYEANENLAAGWPNKSIEYLAGGLPVVSTLDGALRRLLDENDCGIFVPEPTGEAVASALRTLKSTPGRRQSLAENARRLFERAFTAEKVLASYCEYLDDVVRSRM